MSTIVVSDGIVQLGHASPHDDRWLAFNRRGDLLGTYDSADQAVLAIHQATPPVWLSRGLHDHL